MLLGSNLENELLVRADSAQSYLLDDDSWQSLDNWLRYGLHNTSFSQVFGYNYFEKASSKGELGVYFKYEKY
jgi:hypothetical protein